MKYVYKRAMMWEATFRRFKISAAKRKMTLVEYLDMKSRQKDV